MTLTMVCVSFFGNDDNAVGAYVVAAVTTLFVLVVGPGRTWLARHRKEDDSA